MTESDDATLSALEIFPSSTPPLATLNPTFDSGVTAYTATVANEHTMANIEATRNDANATIEFLDKDDTTIPTDVGTNLEVAWIIPNLDVGDNVFKVKVTAEDATTTKTYTVTIRRAAADLLVGNLGQTSESGGIEINSNTATQFTTGNNTVGYSISAVRLAMQVPTGATPRVSIYSDVSGSPGASLKELTNPSNFSTTTKTEVEFEGDNYQLQRETSYWVVIEDTADTSSITVAYTGSNSEDAGGAQGWNIGNDSRARFGGSWTEGVESYVVQIAVKGALATATAPGAPATLTATAGDTQATLT